MDATLLPSLAEGQLNLHLLRWTGEGKSSLLEAAYAVPVLSRSEGVILAIPPGFLAPTLLALGPQSF